MVVYELIQRISLERQAYPVPNPFEEALVESLGESVPRKQGLVTTQWAADLLTSSLNCAMSQ